MNFTRTLLIIALVGFLSASLATKTKGQDGEKAVRLSQQVASPNTTTVTQQGNSTVVTKTSKAIKKRCCGCCGCCNNNNCCCNRCCNNCCNNCCCAKKCCEVYYKKCCCCNNRKCGCGCCGCCKRKRRDQSAVVKGNEKNTTSRFARVKRSLGLEEPAQTQIEEQENACEDTSSSTKTE